MAQRDPNEMRLEYRDGRFGLAYSVRFMRMEDGVIYCWVYGAEFINARGKTARKAGENLHKKITKAYDELLNNVGRQDLVKPEGTWE